MLSKKRRIQTPYFSEIIKKGLRQHSQHFFVSVVPHKESFLSHWAVVVPKKVAKFAAHRNRLKRKINGFLQKNPEVLPQQWSGIIFAKPGAEQLELNQYSDELNILFKRLESVHTQ